MFNLLMFNVDWASSRVSVPSSRVFEYTEDSVKQQFYSAGTIDFDKILQLPCIFCEEGVGDEVAHVGRVNRVQPVGADFSIEFSIDRDLPSFKNSYMFKHAADLGMQRRFEFTRNHWAVKDVDLYYFLLRNAPPRRRLPTVFNIKEHDEISDELVSVMMPFEASFSSVYSAIQESTSALGLKCLRADDFWEHAAIIQDIVSLIDRSRVVVCDCTGRNPNVFYEAGIAHTLGREVILLTQSETDVPFDLRHLRYIKYLNNNEGRKELSRRLEDRLRTIVQP